MLKTVKKIFRNWQQDDKGIAILFTLGILSLLLILAMSFATDAIIERKAAYNNNTRTQSKWLAKSALNRAVAAMQYYIAYPQTAAMTAPLTFDHIVSGSEVSTSTDTNCNATTSYSDLIKSTSPQTSRLFTVDSDRYCEEFSDYTSAANDKVKWQYVYSPTTSAIIGRYAYATFVDTGRIDLAASVDSCAGSSIAESLDNSSTATKPRPGIDVSEIALYGMNSAYTLTATGTTSVNNTCSNLAALSCKPVGGQLARDGKRWLSMEQVLSNGVLNFMPSSASDYATKLKRGYFYSLSNIYNQPDPEAYWVDLNGNNKLDMTTVGGSASYELYHRFNIGRNDWTTGPFAVTNTTGDQAVNRLLCQDSAYSPVAYNSAYTGNSGIQFLRKIGAGQGTFGSMTALRKQIAANLINYCSPEATPVVSDVDPTSWDENHRPSYTGNKRTHYINKIGVKTDIVVTISGAAPDYTVTYSFYVYPRAELINIYSSILSYLSISPLDYKLKLRGTVTHTAVCTGGTSGGGTNNSVDVPFTCTFTIPKTGGYVVADDSTGFPIVATYTWNIHGAAGPPTFTIPNPLTIKLDYAVLKNNAETESYDYVSFLNGAGVYHSANTGATGDFFSLSTVSAAGTSAPYLYVSTQTNDPRQNLNAGDWDVCESSTSAVITWSDTTTCKWGSKNYLSGVVINPSTIVAGCDKETATDPQFISSADGQHLSTAYIRHGPMQSPWELGAIHRGVAWQTINLLGAKTTDGSSTGGVGHYNYIIPSAASLAAELADATGGCAYVVGGSAGGDGGILDQVKMSDATTSYGKVSLNGQGIDVYRALFWNVMVGSDYSTPGATTGTKAQSLVTSSSENYLSKLISMYLVPYNGKALQRSILCDHIVHDLVMTNNAQAEALVGKVINLTQANIPSSEIRIMVIAQTIRDIGGASSTISVTKARGDGATGTVSKNCQISVFDYDATSKTYFDEITGEQKIYAIVSRDPVTNKFKIKKIEYIQE